MNSWSERKRRAAGAARETGVEALLVTHPPDARWLTGFTGSNAAVALISGPRSPQARLFTDGRYTTQARSEAPGTAVQISAGSAAAAAAAWIAAVGVKRCGFDDTRTSVAALGSLRAALPAALRRSLFVSTGPLISRLRETKDAGEIATMRSAAALGCQLFDSILGIVEPGMTETAVAAELEHRARLAGAEAMSFETIVASGPRSALPHGRASAAKLPRRGFCTLDFGVVLDGYCSDMTRTVHFGRPDNDARRVYDAVLEAQQAGVAAVREGVLASDVDEAARSILRQAKLDKWFTHSTGHGLGLEIHEGPRLARRPDSKTSAAQKTPPEILKSGMVVTIEPGVYLPGRFGVRIEDTVVVNRTGSENLTPSTKALIQL